MKQDSIFYTTTFEEVEGQKEPTMAFQFNHKALEYAGITKLEQVKDDQFKMTLIEKAKEKEIQSHVLGIISYLDDLENNVIAMNEMIKLVNNKPEIK